MNKIAAVMVGAPGSGKSTYAKELAEMLGGEVVSLDSIREDLWGDEAIQGDWAALRGALADRLSSLVGTPVVLDGTHYRRRYRREAVATLRDFGYETVMGVLVDTPYDLCLLRNSKRDRKVPEDVIEHMWSIIRANKTTISEDFDAFSEITPDVDLPEWYG